MWLGLWFVGNSGRGDYGGIFAYYCCEVVDTRVCEYCGPERGRERTGRACVRRRRRECSIGYHRGEPSFVVVPSCGSLLRLLLRSSSIYLSASESRENLIIKPELTYNNVS